MWRRHLTRYGFSLTFPPSPPDNLVPSQLFGPRNWGVLLIGFSILRTRMNGSVINGWEIVMAIRGPLGGLVWRLNLEGSGLTFFLIRIDRRDEHTNIGFFTTLRCTGTSNATVWTGIGVSPITKRGGGHAPYAASEPRCVGPDTDGGREPGSGIGGANGPAKGLQARGRAHGSVPGRLQGHRWVCRGRCEETAWSK